jgi:hypothetical protein
MVGPHAHALRVQMQLQCPFPTHPFPALPKKEGFEKVDPRSRRMTVENGTVASEERGKKAAASTAGIQWATPIW